MEHRNTFRGARWPIILVGLVLACSPARAQVLADPALLAEIQGIRAIDGHCHCLPVESDRMARWRIEDPLGAPPYPAVVRLRVDNAEWARAWQALYGYTGAEVGVEPARKLLPEKLRRMRELGERYPEWVLDQAGIDVAFVNADSLGPGQTGPRFRWVPYATPLTTPSAASARDLAREVDVDELPSTLSAYTARVVVPVLDRWAAQGVPAIKFTTAYRRSLDIAQADAPAAEDANARSRQGTASARDERVLEDY